MTTTDGVGLTSGRRDAANAGTGFGVRLRSARRKVGLTQSDLADGLVSAAYVSRIEHGQRTPSMAVLDQFCAKLGVSPDELLRPDEAALAARLRLATADRLLSLGRYSEAVEAAESLTNAAEPPIDEAVARDALRIEALVGLETGRIARACALLEWLRDQGPNDDSALQIAAALSRCYLASGQSLRAIEIARTAHRRITELDMGGLPEATAVGAALYSALIGVGENDEASRIGRQVLELAPSSAPRVELARAFARASAIESRSGSLVQAVRHAERAATVAELVRQHATIEWLSTQLKEQPAAQSLVAPGTTRSCPNLS